MAKMLLNLKTSLLPLLITTSALMPGRTEATCWCSGDKLGGCAADINRVFNKEWSDAGDGVRYGSESGCKSTAAEINYHPDAGSDTIYCSGGHGHCRGWSNGGCYGHLKYGSSSACQRGAAKLTRMFTDECLPKPCLNGGTCADGVNSYSCTCQPGFSGSTCAVDINECQTKPCQNGGTCTDGVNSYSCTCPLGFSGSTCAVNIDECAPEPCQNGGTCADGFYSYTCTCKPGYSGSTCSITTTITTITTTISTTSATTTTYQPQLCHGVLEAAGCGTRIATEDCSVGGVHQEFAETHCPVMCGLECTSTVTTATSSTTTVTTSTSTSTTTTTTTTTITTTTIITTISTTSATTTTYQPQLCRGVLEAAGCGTRIPTGDCSVGGVHQEFAETHCPVLCGVECASTATTTTALAAVAGKASIMWLSIHNLCDPRKDLCDHGTGLVCDHATYTCRYRTTTTMTTTAVSAVTLTSKVPVDDEQTAAAIASDDSGSGSTNTGLYACVGTLAFVLLAGIAAIWYRGCRSAQKAGMPNTSVGVGVGVNNPMYDESGTHGPGESESSYKEVDVPAQNLNQSRTGAINNAAYEEVLGSLDDYTNTNNNATYQDVIPNADGWDASDNDMEC